MRVGLTRGGQPRPPEEPRADVGAEGGVCRARPMCPRGWKHRRVARKSRGKEGGKAGEGGRRGSAGGEPRGKGYSYLIPSN